MIHAPATSCNLPVASCQLQPTAWQAILLPKIADIPYIYIYIYIIVTHPPCRLWYSSVLVDCHRSACFNFSSKVDAGKQIVCCKQGQEKVPALQIFLSSLNFLPARSRQDPQPGPFSSPGASVLFPSPCPWLLPAWEPSGLALLSADGVNFLKLPTYYPLLPLLLMFWGSVLAPFFQLSWDALSTGIVVLIEGLSLLQFHSKESQAHYFVIFYVISTSLSD